MKKPDTKTGPAAGAGFSIEVGQGAALIDEGAYSARVATVIDLGIQAPPPGGKGAPRRQFATGYEVMGATSGNVELPVPPVMYRRYNQSWGPKAELPKFLRAVLGRDPQVGEKLSAAAWLGKAVTVTVEHTTRADGGTWSEILEVLKDKLHAVLFRLEEIDPNTPSRLVIVDPAVLELPDGVRMEVARYTTPHDVTPFPNGSVAVEIPGCATALRTRFVVCTLHNGDDEVAWIAAANLDPALGDERDRELVARLLGMREFLAYLQSLRSDEFVPGTIEGEPNDGTPNQTPQGHHAEPPTSQCRPVDEVDALRRQARRILGKHAHTYDAVHVWSDRPRWYRSSAGCDELARYP